MVKTIHKSKGLEFPFVFLVETDTGFSIEDKKPVQFSYENGFGLDCKIRRVDEVHYFTI